MEGEIDTNVKDMIYRLLTEKGVLGKIKAKIRANVFQLFNEQKPASSVNPCLTNFLETENGEVVLSLVRQLLETLNLKYTLSVFDAETNEGHDYLRHERNQLLQELNLDEEEEYCIQQPVLSQIIDNFTCEYQTSPEQNANEDSKASVEDNEESKEDPLNLNLALPQKSDTANEVSNHPQNNNTKEWLRDLPEEEEHKNSDNVSNTIEESSNGCNSDSNINENSQEMILDSSYTAPQGGSSVEKLPPIIQVGTKKKEIGDILEDIAIVHDTEDSSEDYQSSGSNINKNLQDHLPKIFNRSLSSEKLPPISDAKVRNKVTGDMLEIVKMGLEECTEEETNISDITSKNDSNEWFSDKSLDSLNESVKDNVCEHDKAVSAVIPDAVDMIEISDDDVGGATVVSSSDDDNSAYNDALSKASSEDEDKQSHYSDVASDQKDNDSVHSNLSFHGSDSLHNTNNELPEHENVNSLDQEQLANDVECDINTPDEYDIVLNDNYKNDDSDNRISYHVNNNIVSKDHGSVDGKNNSKPESEGEDVGEKTNILQISEQNVAINIKENEIETAIYFEFQDSKTPQKHDSTQESSVSQTKEISADCI